MKKFLILVPACICMYTLLPAQEWHTTGNSGTSASTNFIGTKDNVAFKIRTNNSVRMTVSSGGKIGIGTTSPKSKLDVAGTILGLDSYFGKTYPISAGTSGASYSSVGYGLTFTDTTENYRYRLNDFSSMINFFAGGFIFKTAPLGTAGNIIPYTAAMTILQNGNVGVGPGIPGFRFHIRAAPPSRTPVALIENTTGGDNTNYGLFIKAGTNISTFSYFINFSRPDGLSIGGVMQGSANTVLYLTSSDKRLKNIIGTSQKGLSDLMKIKIYDYTFKSDIEKKVHTGFIAQELYNVFPQSVGKPIDNNESAEKDPWMVDYGSVTPLIIKSVQEQQQIIEDLKKLNDELKKQNEQQKEEIDKLKNIVQVLANKAGLKISSGVFASLEQNIPNPSKGSTTIAYHIPSTNSSAYINFYASSGALLKSVKLDSKSSGTINVKASELPAGVYQYALVVEGKVVDRKQMVQSK